MQPIIEKRIISFAAAVFLIAIFLIISTIRWNRTVQFYESLVTEVDVTESAHPGKTAPIFLDNDAYYWVSYAQEMATAGKWRIRHTLLDNPPDGRAVHWSQSVSWMLLFGGFVRNIITGESLPDAIENTAIWIGPTQFFLLLAITGFLLFRGLGLIPSLLWMLSLLSNPTLQWCFHPMRPDHHGLHLGFLITSSICLILGGLGWIRSGPEIRMSPGLLRPFSLPGRREARGFFVASGIMGGLGIWTGASVQLFGIGIIALGAILLVLFMPSAQSLNQEAGSEYDPSLWRLWAVSGSATALFFYLVEYAPSFPGMRLEVNHPLYAVSWLCAGELLMRLASKKTLPLRVSILWTGLALLGALLLPVLLIFGPSHWHAMHDPFMQRLHQFIDEFQTYRSTFQSAPLKYALENVGLLPVFLVAAPLLAGKKQITTCEWAALWVAFIPALAYAALTLWQVRWMNFFVATSLLLALVTTVIVWRHQPRSLGGVNWFTFLLMALFMQAAYWFSVQFRDLPYRDISRERVGELIAPIFQRQFAANLGALNTHHAYRIMGGPHMAARLHYYGDLPCVSSYYWENLEGLRAATRFFASADEEEARKVIQERGITHVVIPPSADFARMFFYIRHGAMSEKGASESMTGRMLLRPESLPPWIKRDVALEKKLQPGFIFAGAPLTGTLQVFTIQMEAGHQSRGPDLPQALPAR